MRKTLITLGATLMTFIILSAFANVYAATNISVNPNSNVKPGDTITVTVTVSGVATWDVHVTASGPVSGGSIDLVGNTEDLKNGGQTKSGTYTVTGEGTINIATTSGSNAITEEKEYANISASTSVVSKSPVEEPKTPTEEPETPTEEPETPQEQPNTNTEPETPSTNTNTGTTNNNPTTNTNTNTNTNTEKTKEEQVVKSSNNYLESIKLSGGTLTPEFNKRVTSYTVNVEKETKKIKITAITEDKTATVKGDGEIELENEETTAKIQVIAENGSTNTYTLKIKKGLSDETNDKTIGIQAISVDMINEKGEYNKVSLTPSFNSSIYEYKCEVPKEVTELSVEAVPNNEKMAIEILGNKNLHEGENVVTIIVKDTENEETLTYQILVQKSSIETNIISSQNKNQNENPNIRKIIFVSCVIAIVILGISFGIIEYKYSKDNSYDEDEEDEEDEDDDYDDEREKSKNQILNSGDKGGRHF